MKTYLKYLAPYYLRMAGGLAIKFSGTIMDLMIPYILEHIIDNIVPKKDLHLIYFWGGIMLICSAYAVVSNIIANRMASRVARDTTGQLRYDLFSKISYLSCKQTDGFTIPSLESRLTTDTYNVHQFTGMMQRMGVRAPILLIGGLILSSMMDPMLTLVLAATLPLLTISVFFISKRCIPLYTNLQSATDVMVKVVRENIQGIRVIKALSKTDYEKMRFRDVTLDLMKKEKRAGITMATTNPIMNLLLYVGLTVVIIVGAIRVNAGVSEVGKIIAMMSYFTYILNAMLSVTRIFITYTRFAASMERIERVLKAPEDLSVLTEEDFDTENENDSGNEDDNSINLESVTAKTAPHIEFCGVSFSYSGKKNNVSDVSFTLMRGETLGIIGATGSGKTTLISLLLRLYDPTRGTIKINGHDIRRIKREELSTMFGIALQNDFLFADTVMENIKFGRDISDEEVIRAAETAQASEFIDNKENGYNFILDIKGANLSGGQKQRLTIARALAGNPEILILDDSSSALDYKTDARLRRELAEQYRDATKIIVTQRVSSIMSAEHIIVMDDGKIIASSTHDELMKSCDIYREIAESQMGGAIFD
ncbi:MAG: ABC transporter ATP-binding protein [Eubacteriales bacterium]